MMPVTTIEDIEIELRHAVWVLRCLPSDGPKKVRAYWPDFRSETPTAHGIEAYLRPLPEEIDDMDLVLEKWLKILPPDDRRLVFYRASGWGWKRLTFVLGRVRSTLSLHYKNALEKILAYALTLQNEDTK
jgi:hypothetical protein